MSEKERKTTKSHCNICDGEKNHEVLYKEKITDSDGDEYSSVDWWNCYELLKCCGCENISLRHQSAFSEDFDPRTGEPYIRTAYYPPSQLRKKPRWYQDGFLLFEDSYDVIHELLDEIYICLQNDAPRLAAMGVRSLIEHVMLDKIKDQGTFKKNLAKFMENGFISQIQNESIESALEAGHAAIHRSYKPNRKTLIDVLDITENLIEMLYVNPIKSKRVSEGTPKRSKD